MPSPTPEPVKFLIYPTEDGKAQVRVLVDGETCWMNQKAIAELFETSVANINTHIRNILGEYELSPEATIKDYLIVQSEGSRQVERQLTHYRLEMVLAVGFRVRSPRGTQFRRWAAGTLSEFLVKGFVMDDDRLADAKKTFGKDYFDELLERIRRIRASEKRFYQKITDIYATAGDYDAKAETTQTFFATVQNKLEWAITGQTAAELIHARVDADKPHMGLTSWKQAPGGFIRKSDVTVAKNYLSREELDGLNRIVTMYLDYAEDQAKRQQPMTMRQWADKLNAFLAFNGRAVLTHAGKVQKAVADKLALDHFERFDAAQQLAHDQKETDFDRFMAGLKRIGEQGRGGKA